MRWRSLMLRLGLLLWGGTTSTDAGTITLVDLPVTGTDAASGISSTNTYVCALGFGGGATGFSMSGVKWQQLILSGKDARADYDHPLFVTLASVYYNPPDVGGPSANRVAIARLNGAPLAVNVAAVKFDFTTQSGSLDNGYSGYAEIVLQGTSLPGFNAPYVSGGKLILTGTGTPGSSYELLTSTNVAARVAAWTTNATGVVNGSGVFSNAIPFSVSEHARFFRIKTP
jgi:hypothetical protein